MSYQAIIVRQFSFIIRQDLVFRKYLILRKKLIFRSYCVLVHSLHSLHSAQLMDIFEVDFWKLSLTGAHGAEILGTDGTNSDVPWHCQLGSPGFFKIPQITEGSVSPMFAGKYSFCSTFRCNDNYTFGTLQKCMFKKYIYMQIYSCSPVLLYSVNSSCLHRF